MENNKKIVNPDNTVNTSSVVEKTYSRADMIHALTYGHNKAKSNVTHVNTLIEYKEEH